MKSLKVCIDPGHGMSNRKTGVYDPGACSGPFSEADIVLQWGLTLKFVFEEAGIPVYMTRKNDKDSNPVGTRDDRAEAQDCTHFISLHCNAGESRATGTETYYRDASDKNFASVIQKATLETLGLKDRGLKTEHDSQHSRLAIFDFDGPACLLELGFISNRNDRDKMLLRANRVKFAEKLRDYFKGLK